MENLFDDPGEIIAEDGLARVRAHSTEQSRQRHAYLRTRRIGETCRWPNQRLGPVTTLHTNTPRS
jgi:hypothetical protein